MPNIKEIAKEYLSSLPRISRKELEAKEVQDHRMREKIRMGQVTARDIRLPSVKESATTLLEEVLPKSQLLQAALTREKITVLNKTSWKDFSLLAGNAKSPEASVLNQVKRTTTYAGTCVMATELVNPKTDQQLLIKQQNTLKCLKKSPKMRKRLNREMAGIARSERMRIALWQKRSDINSSIFQEKISDFYFKGNTLRRWNRSPMALQVHKILGDWHRQIALAVFTLIVMPYICYCAYLERALELGYTRIVTGLDPLTFTFRFPPPLGFFESLSYHFKQTIFPFLYFFQNSHFFSEIKVGDRLGVFDTYMAGKLNFEETVSVFSLEFIKLGSWLLLISHIRKRRATINFLAAHLVAFQDLLYHADRICGLVARKPDLKALYGGRLLKTWALLQTQEGELGQLVRNLRTKNFRSRWYFFNSTGNLLVTYKLLEEHKNDLADLIYEMGLLDVQLGVIKLMEEHGEEKVPNPITFGRFTEASKNLPQLHATGIWHPFLNSRDAIPNDANMDVERSFFIITGPNAGGKTTYILSLGINAIFNQVFGITYAKSFNQTIFYKIITYVNVIQDLSKGLSLADAGMEVLRIHKEILNRTKQPMLAIVDEILNGVDPKVAQKYSYKILKQRSRAHLNCLTLVTTHLMNLTELAKEDPRFHNKKVVVNIPGHHGRAFDYTYQIRDGITDQNVVEMMLEEKGVI